MKIVLLRQAIMHLFNSYSLTVLKKQIFQIKVANLLTSGSLDVIRMLPLGAYIPEDAEPWRSPPCIWLRNSPRLFEIKGSSIITISVDCERISRIFFLEK